MQNKFRLLAVVALFCVVAAPRASAQNRPQPSAAASPEAQDEETPQLAPSEGQLQFAARYVKAIDARDVEALRKLVAPRTLACYTPRTMPYLDTWLKRQIQDQIPKPYTVTIETRSPDQLPKSMLFTMPVPPTHQMNITIKGDSEDTVLGRPIAYQDGQWYEAAPCPTDMGMEFYLKRQATAKKQAAEIDKLYSRLADPLRSDLATLIKQNKIPEACKKYADANKVPYRTGCDVVRKLASTMTASN